jgi:hypothetical protein
LSEITNTENVLIMKKTDFSYYIERYNAKEMTAAEQQWFENELDGNSGLRDEIIFRKRVDDVLMRQDVLSLRDKLNAIEAERKNAAIERKLKIRTGMRYAAAFTGFVLILSFVLLSGRRLTNEELFEKFHTSYYEPGLMKRSAEDKNAYSADYKNGIRYYNNHDWSNAAKSFSSDMAVNPENLQSAFLGGISNFEDQKYEAAEALLLKVINDNSTLNTETSKWYLALCYLRRNEIDKAVRQLELIINEQGIYMKAAKKLLRKLR